MYKVFGRDNIARRDACWQSLLDSDYDIALLQEAHEPPADVAAVLQTDPGEWRTNGAGKNRPWRAALAIINPEIGFEWIDTKPLTDACPGEFGVSRPGTIVAAKIFPKDADPIIVTSIYAPWELPHSSTNSSWKVGNADASAHRILRPARLCDTYAQCILTRQGRFIANLSITAWQEQYDKPNAIARAHFLIPET